MASKPPRKHKIQIEDRVSRLFEKSEQCQRTGIPNIIIVEPTEVKLLRKYVNGKSIPL